ncbi:Pentatricopeptide repeat-containing protein [Apostasia shenzhenica]|uniref:Pentatricopeptide repeat-containing protein n=1 Tax=Apostasia shenzhenica TaxID=1088818 RepID=A0A2I0BER9_9ASPA|nr:Pentatricopeptide repeat-containing protein [Apostasia shenzhenica]
MVELLGFCSVIRLSAYDARAECYSGLKSGKVDMRFFKRGLAFSSTEQRILRNPSLQHPRRCLETPLILRYGLVCTGEKRFQANTEEAGSVVFDKNENEEGGVISKEIHVEIEHMDPFSYLESGFMLSEFKVHFLEERDEEILSNRILTLSRSNKSRSALELYLSMVFTGLRTDAHACNSLLACLIRNSLINNVLLVFETIRKRGLATSHTYSLVLKAVASSRGHEQALEMFNSLESEGEMQKFDIVVYNTMISICGKAKTWIGAEKLWRKFHQNNVNGTIITYSLLISTFVQCGQTELALDAYHEMIMQGLVPDENIMKAIVASCSKDGKWDMALSTLRRMIDSGIKPSVIAYNSVINCLGKAGEADLAFKVYELMKSTDQAADIHTWSALLCALYRSKRYSDALKLFESIRSQQILPLNALLYYTVLMCCQKMGLWERSLQLLWQMETSGIEMSTLPYNHVIHACESARRPEVALQVYQHMRDQKREPDMFTHLSLIRICIWGCLWTELEIILEFVPLDASICNALVQGFCLRGKTTLAKNMYQKMHDIGVKPDGKTRALMLQHLSS